MVAPRETCGHCSPVAGENPNWKDVEANKGIREVEGGWAPIYVQHQDEYIAEVLSGRYGLVLEDLGWVRSGWGDGWKDRSFRLVVRESDGSWHEDTVKIGESGIFGSGGGRVYPIKGDEGKQSWEVTRENQRKASEISERRLAAVLEAGKAGRA